MARTDPLIRTALFEGLSRFGLGMVGMPYPEEPTLINKFEPTLLNT